MKISKQVIVMRKSFIIDEKKITPRKGKYIAQGAHASLGAILNQMIRVNGKKDTLELILNEGSAIKDWIDNSFTKVCCVVETEEELLIIYNKAKEKGLICSLITDNGRTEFGGVSTITCCAIGPAWSEELEDITDKLELF